MLQVVIAASKDPADNTQFYLIFANKTEDDILLRKELEVCIHMVVTAMLCFSKCRVSILATCMMLSHSFSHAQTAATGGGEQEFPSLVHS